MLAKLGSRPLGLALSFAFFLFVGKSFALTPEEVTVDVAMDYFNKYGYAGDTSPDARVAELMTSDPEMALRVGIMTFQAKYASYGLNMTGELDEATRTLMAMPRCGMKDVMVMEDLPGMDMDGVMEGGSLRRKRYATVGSGWSRTDLTYRIMQYTPDISQAVVDSDIGRALQVWADVTPLTFTRRTSGDADILVYFIRGNAHFQLDGSNFDGPSGVLAHAYFPFNSNPIEGDAHFDEDEVWTSGTFSGTNMFQVAAHEFGHSLGLSHSEIDAALMAPFYTGYQPNFELHPDDIRGIQSLYGGPDTGMGGGDGDGMGGPDSTTRTPITPPTGMPNFCANPRLDAMTAHWEQGVMRNYAFQGDYYARLDNSLGIMEGYPRRISDDWQGVTGSIDAALYLPEDNELPAYTLLFKGANYYVYTDDLTYVAVNDNSLSRFDLPEGMEGIDAAFVWGRNGRIYVMKDNMYYRLKRRNNNNVNRLLKMNKGYPKDLSIWNLPVDSIDGAHMWINGRTYFFKDHLYYRYDDATVSIDADATPPYPRDIGTWWLGCNNNYVASDNNDGSSGVATSHASMATVVMASLLLLAKVFFH